MKAFLEKRSWSPANRALARGRGGKAKTWGDSRAGPPRWLSLAERLLGKEQAEGSIPSRGFSTCETQR